MPSPSCLLSAFWGPTRKGFGHFASCLFLWSCRNSPLDMGVLPPMLAQWHCINVFQQNSEMLHTAFLLLLECLKFSCSHVSPSTLCFCPTRAICFSTPSIQKLQSLHARQPRICLHSTQWFPCDWMLHFLLQSQQVVCIWQTFLGDGSEHRLQTALATTTIC